MKTLLNHKLTRRLPTSGTLGVLGGLLAVVVFASGCGGGSGAICENSRNCEGGNEDDQNACNISYDALSDLADSHGCGSEYDNYVDCVNDNARCNDHQYRPDDKECSSQQNTLSKCVGN